MGTDERDYTAWFCPHCGQEVGMMGHGGGGCPVEAAVASALHTGGEEKDILGAAMRTLRGKANPACVLRLIRERRSR